MPHSLSLLLLLLSLLLPTPPATRPPTPPHRAQVKEAMRARPDSNYTSCSQLVGGVMAADTMQSVKALLPDILRRLPVLLYQVGGGGAGGGVFVLCVVVLCVVVCVCVCVCGCGCAVVCVCVCVCEGGVSVMLLWPSVGGGASGEGVRERLGTGEVQGSEATGG